jgi:hypothetical protein
MSDISNFVRRSNETSHDEINKLLTLINPLAFAEPEDDALKERDILADQVRKRLSSSLQGTDITTTSTGTRNRTSSSITLLPDTSTPTAFPVTPTLTGTLTFPNKKNGGGALFDGTQYISIPDDNQIDLTLPYFTMAFWFKANNSGGSQTIWNKGDFTFDKDFCGTCTDFDTDDYSTTDDTTTTPGLQVRLESNSVADFDSDHDSAYSTSTFSDRIRVIISDGTNLVDDTITTANLFDNNWHSIVIISTDTLPDYCSACADFDSDYSTVATPIITIYLDGVSKGTIDHSSITGDLSNSNSAFLGSKDTSLYNPLIGNLALFEYQGINWDSTDISNYHTKARIRVSNQKTAFHFIGNDTTEDTLANVY